MLKLKHLTLFNKPCLCKLGRIITLQATYNVAVFYYAYIVIASSCNC